MLLHNGKDVSGVFVARGVVISDIPVDPHYLFLVDILMQLHCNSTDASVAKVTDVNYIPNIAPIDSEEIVTATRKKRGVMENIVSAYADIFTKG